MKKTISTLAMALVLSSFVISAHAALSASVTSGATTQQALATTQTFSDGSRPSGYTGGGFFNTTTGEYATPVGSTDYYFSVGTSGGQPGPAVVTFAAPVSYFGFLWGSPDSYNTVSFYSGSSLLGSYTDGALWTPANGNQGMAVYFNVFTNGGPYITSVQFTSTSNAFETDNHSFITAVPEPETYAMMLAGLGLMGFIARRRS